MSRTRLAPVIESSRTIHRLQSVSDRLGTVAGQAATIQWAIRIGTAFRHAWATSRTEQGRIQGSNGVRHLLDGSTVFGAMTARIDSFARTGHTARETARVGTLGHLMGQAIRQSLLFRWLTAEPEPAVIVIDLRDTWTAGPVIAGIDRTIAELMPGVKSARLTQSIVGIWNGVIRKPLRSIGIVVGLAGVVSLGLTALHGAPGPGLLVAHVLVLLVAIAGIRSEVSYVQLRDHRVIEAVAAAFEPPKPIEPTQDETSGEDKRRDE